MAGSSVHHSTAAVWRVWH